MSNLILDKSLTDNNNIATLNDILEIFYNNIDYFISNTQLYNNDYNNLIQKINREK